jgi:ABC-type sugar transport system permease subunit
MTTPPIVTGAVYRRRRRFSPLRARDTINGLLFISPWLVGLLVFTLYPIGASFFYSFTDYSVLEPPHWVGLDNYRDLLTANHLFFRAVSNTLFYAALSIPLNITVSLLIALLLNLNVRGMSIYRTIFFNLVLGVMGAFQAFTTVYVLTGGGPVDSTHFYALLLYRNAFTYFKMGYASAMAWILFIFVLAITLIIFKSSGRWVYYEGEGNG